MKRFEVTITLTDAEVGKLLHIMRSIRKTDDGPIPESFRQAILNADPRQHSAMLQRGLSKPPAQEALRMRGMPHSEVVHDEYMSRLAAYKRHMSNPNIQTIEHLRNVLYPPNS